MTPRTRVAIFLAAVVLGASGVASAQPVRDLYTQALARDRTVRDARQSPTRQQIRSAIAQYERVVRRYPRSGYSDNALWQASELARLAWDRFGEDVDRQTAVRLLTLLKSGYPASPLARNVDEAVSALEAPRPAAAPIAKTSAPARVAASDAPASRAAPSADRGSAAVGMVRGITRTSLPDGVRISIEADRELFFHQEQIENPRRLFFDLRGATTTAELRDKTMKYADDIVREIRLGRHPQSTTRIVMDTEGVESYSVFTLYNPYRVIVDFRRRGAPAVPAITFIPPVPPAVSTTGSAKLDTRPVAPSPSSTPAATPPPMTAAPPASIPSPPVNTGPPPSRDIALAAPAIPLANSNGAYSLARQLGLGVSRIVLDPGHGGHDPGVRGNGLNESELVLDVTLRLKKLLEKAPGIDVVLTRETDVFIPLEQRTAIANRQGADLFLSIHANASRNLKARGIETYFLNFAANPEAEAVAARENSASGQTMHRLPDIVRAITLNNKLDESRDFAETLQKTMVQSLSSRNRDLQDRGVKQAPFVVLIGAGMPSVLAEISFVSNKQEGQLLKTPAYRQQIAEALCDAVLKYQRSLKSKVTIAARED
jgi:N-acetylmuramoyl-L-alanine amidase